jgi:hypothetical protein
MRPLVTPRRRETLEVLRALVTGAPAGAVHYSEVGRRLGVSAWTAYGLLRDLEGLGLAVRRYAVPRSAAGGRSRILFAPASLHVDGEADGESILRAAFERFAAIGDEAAAVRAYVAEAGSDVAFHLGFWLGRLDATGRHAFDAARAMLEGGSLPAAKVQAIAAMGLGSSLAHLGPARLSRRLTKAATSLTIALDDVSRASDARLAALIEAARGLGDPMPPAPPARRIVT